MARPDWKKKVRLRGRRGRVGTLWALLGTCSLHSCPRELNPSALTEAQSELECCQGYGDQLLRDRLVVIAAARSPVHAIRWHCKELCAVVGAFRQPFRDLVCSWRCVLGSF